MQPFGRNRYGPKIGGLCPLGEGELGPHLTQCDRTGRRRDKCPSDARRKSRVQKLGEGPDSLLVPRRKLGRNYNAKRRVTFAVGNVAF